jgi:hypothetical protein
VVEDFLRTFPISHCQDPLNGPLISLSDKIPESMARASYFPISIDIHAKFTGANSMECFSANRFHEDVLRRGGPASWTKLKTQISYILNS